MTKVCSNVARRHNTRLHTRTKIGSWLSLPTEIRLIILKKVARDKHPGWSTLASVCREWQHVLARENLRKLKLSASCLDGFGRLITTQRDFVHRIWLNIELQQYTCRQCESLDYLSRDNQAIFTTAIRKIFSILSKWKPGKGLTLELNAYSPSDQDHFFKELYFATDDEGDIGPEVARPQWHDPDHGWVNGHKVEPPSRPAILRLFGHLSLSLDQQKLPLVKRVTRFIARRQLRKSLSFPSLRLILDGLCCLQHMVYEPWRGWERTAVVMADMEHYRLFGRCLPPTLKSLTVFEDFDENIAETLISGNSWSWYDPVSRYRIVDPFMGAIFASKSIGLEHLSVSFMVHAEDFFKSCIEEPWTWRRLETLALTSRLFQEGKPHEEINDLLHKASVVARRMPKLRTMVLWNGARGNACAFVFRAEKGCDSLTWRSTWDLGISRKVEEGWEQVASKVHSCPLRVIKERIHGQVASHGDSIHLLDLPCHVVEPASLWQIRREGALPSV